MTLPSDPQPPDFALIRVAGAIIGAVLSLIYVRPASIRDLLARGLFSSISGYVFGFVVLDYMDWPETPRYWMAATVVVAGFSWLLAGVGVRVLRSADKLPWSK